MGIAERRLRQKEEVRAAILKAAWDIVAKEGWQALSIRKIADAIEYSVPVIYDHFANKEAILFEFTTKGFCMLNERIGKEVKRHPEPQQQIRAIAYAYWEFAFGNKEYYRLMYGLGMPTCETIGQIPQLKTFTELILAPINKLIAESKNPDTDSMLKLHTFWSMLHGLISINMMESQAKKDELNEKVLKDMIDGFISGIKS
jgi:AcrR family transcriptional regulator